MIIYINFDKYFKYSMILPIPIFIILIGTLTALDISCKKDVETVKYNTCKNIYYNTTSFDDVYNCCFIKISCNLYTNEHLLMSSLIIICSAILVLIPISIVLLITGWFEKCRTIKFYKNTLTFIEDIKDNDV